LIKKFFSFVKIEHTLFSLPVIYSGMALAIRVQRDSSEPVASASELIAKGMLILLAATGARTVGFALNRIIDRHIDAKNPRTAMRDLPSGRMTLREGYAVLIAGLIVYFIAAALLNPLCLMLSPIPLIIFVGYPWLKRWTALVHFGIGLSLALGPLGAYFAIRPNIHGSLPAVLLSLFTWMWVSGFDIIYSTADEAFDKQEGLYSLPAALGSQKALRVSGFVHVLAFGLLAWLYYYSFQGSGLALLLLLLCGVLLYLEQHKATDVELAFFKINAILGFVVFCFVVIGVQFA
jgi:4-hydroxybenzoate polyprenyltransferase